jgi:hypothetical protein
MGFDAGDMNLFRYCGNDPVDQSDPSGLSFGEMVLTDPILNMTPEKIRFAGNGFIGLGMIGGGIAGGFFFAGFPAIAGTVGAGSGLVAGIGYVLTLVADVEERQH